MAINWSHLPKDVVSRICLCSGGNVRGFSRDPATGYWVHADPKCRKPMPYVVKECDLCDVTFVPRFYSKCQLDFMGIMCDTCDPPKEAKEYERIGYTPAT